MKYARIALSLALSLAAAACADDAKSNETSNNGAVNNGTVNNGTVNNGAVNNGTVNNGEGPTVFYYEDVKPLIDASCTACHKMGGIGPFQLTTYEEVAPLGELIKAAVQDKVMPPFLADAACHELEYDPSLSDEDIKLIADWVDQGTPEGDPANEGAPRTLELPTPPVFDTPLTNKPYTPQMIGDGTDDYRCFVLDWPHAEDKFVTGFGVDPGRDELVHHVIAFLATPEVTDEADAMDAGEAGEGYTCFGGPGFGGAENFVWLGSWAPGGVDARYPQGTGLQVPAGSKVVMQVHYNLLGGEPAPDETTVKFETADTVATRGFILPWASPSWLREGGMNIPAGDSDVVHRFTFDPTGFLNVPGLNFWGGFLHMHLLGASATAWVSHSDGSESCLIDIPRYDFNWQNGVRFRTPVRLNPGDSLGLECHHDNSMSKQPIIDGQQVAPVNRSWGEGTQDEMCLGVFYVTVAE